jgi:hypothetical protein
VSKYSSAKYEILAVGQLKRSSFAEEIVLGSSSVADWLQNEL